VIGQALVDIRQDALCRATRADVTSVAGVRGSDALGKTP
jgi:hypothetical protein